ncbi:unnamed protein product [Trichogramma brassicae]|uniref:Uncharacterized protein n=1 Tax=Trichogramma brassicae TaxID=86971 RepID=A0A6H5HXJ0_9HYME|nr:unnamed protein product [Trichogramma brassicae]
MGVAPVGVAGQSCSATCAVHWPKDHPWPAWCALSWRLKKCTYGTCRALDSRETISVHGTVRNHKSSLLTDQRWWKSSNENEKKQNFRACWIGFLVERSLRGRRSTFRESEFIKLYLCVHKNTMYYFEGENFVYESTVVFMLTFYTPIDNILIVYVTSIIAGRRIKKNKKKERKSKQPFTLSQCFMSCCRRGLHRKRNSRHFSFVVVHVCNSNSISSPFFLIIMMSTPTGEWLCCTVYRERMSGIVERGEKMHDNVAGQYARSLRRTFRRIATSELSVGPTKQAFKSQQLKFIAYNLMSNGARHSINKLEESKWCANESSWRTVQFLQQNLQLSSFESTDIYILAAEKTEWKKKLNEERADRRKMQPTLGVCARMSKTLFRHRHRAPPSNNFLMPLIKILDFTPLNPLISFSLYIYPVLRVCIHLSTLIWKSYMTLEDFIAINRGRCMNYIGIYVPRVEGRWGTMCSKARIEMHSVVIGESYGVLSLFVSLETKSIVYDMIQDSMFVTWRCIATHANFNLEVHPKESI